VVTGCMEGVMCDANLCGPIPTVVGVWHIFHPWLILLQRTPRSFVVARMVVVVVVRVGGRVTSDFAWFGGIPPPGSLGVRYFSDCFVDVFRCVVVLWWWWCFSWGDGGGFAWELVGLSWWGLDKWCRNRLCTGVI